MLLAAISHKSQHVVTVARAHAEREDKATKRNRAHLGSHPSKATVVSRPKPTRTCRARTRPRRGTARTSVRTPARRPSSRGSSPRAIAERGQGQEEEPRAPRLAPQQGACRLEAEAHAHMQSERTRPRRGTARTSARTPARRPSSRGRSPRAHVH